MSDKTVRVLFTGGGSGGPTIPLLALAQEIRGLKKDSEFLFLGSKFGPERKMVEQAEIPFSTIPSGNSGVIGTGEILSILCIFSEVE